MRERCRRVPRNVNYSRKNASSATEAVLSEKCGERSGEESGEGKRGNAEKGEGVLNGIKDVIIV